MKTFAIVISLLGSLGCSKPLPSPRTDPGNCVALIATTDVHGTVFPHARTVDGQTVRYGGLMGVAAYLDILRRRFGERLLLVDGGDMFQGTLVGTVSKGQSIFGLYNLLGYHAVALGNHEFDLGPKDGHDPDPLGLLKLRLSEAHFPMVTANVFDETTHDHVRWPHTRPSVLLERGGIKVGIVGASTQETPMATRRDCVAHLTFRDPVPYIVAEAKRMREQGAQLVVLVAHFGGECRDLTKSHDTSSCKSDSELFSVLRRLPAHTVDAAVGGHTHAEVAHWVSGVATIQPEAQARRLGWVDLCLTNRGTLDPERTQIHRPVDLCLEEWQDGGCGERRSAVSTRPATFLGQKVAVPHAPQSWIAPFQSEVKKQYATPIGARLPHPLRRTGPSPNLGEHVCRALARSLHTDLAVQNQGGVRRNLPAGPLSFGQAFEVLPFGNRVAVMTLSGAQLRTLLETLSERSSNLPYVLGIRLQKRPDGSLEIRLPDNSAPSDATTYRVATNEYLATGGSGLQDLVDSLDPGQVELSSTTALQALIRYLRTEFPTK